MLLKACKKIKDSFVPFEAKITYDYYGIGGLDCHVIDILPPKSKGNSNRFWAFKVKFKTDDGKIEKFLTPCVIIPNDFKFSGVTPNPTKSKKLKLFVFHNVLKDYSAGMAFAIADSKESALDQIAKSMGVESFSDYKLCNKDRAREFENSDPEILSLNSPVAFHIYGGS